MLSSECRLWVSTHLPTSVRWSINQLTAELRGEGLVFNFEKISVLQTGIRLSEILVVITGVVQWMRAWTQEGVLHSWQGAIGLQLM
jgi:hypothetical protein